MRWLISLILDALILLALPYLIDGFYLSGFGIALIASLILSIVHTIVKPILIILTLPITVLTLGLFLFVINALLLMLTANIMGDHFVIDSFWTAFIASLLITIAQSFIVNRVKSR